jgi:hypothetical protein
MIRPEFDWDVSKARAVRMAEAAGVETEDIMREGGVADTIASRDLLVHKLGEDGITPKVRDEMLREIVELECKLAPHGLV